MQCLPVLGKGYGEVRGDESGQIGNGRRGDEEAESDDIVKNERSVDEDSEETLRDDIQSERRRSVWEKG